MSRHTITPKDLEHAVAKLESFNVALTEQEHAALEALDHIMVRLMRNTFTKDEAEALRLAIDATEAAMRAAKGTK